MRIAIIGMGPGGEDARGLESWERWALLKDAAMRSYAERLFEMHPGGGGIMDLAQDLRGTPIYWPEQHVALIGDSHFVPYPLEEVISTIGRDWFECSASYMVALAIHERPDEIGLWGIHMGRDSEEYLYQRPNLSWLLGIAEAKGIKVTLPEGCSLLSWSGDKPYPKRYGYAS